MTRSPTAPGSGVLFPVPAAVLTAAIKAIPAIPDDRLAALVEELAYAVLDCFEDAQRVRTLLRLALGHQHQQGREVWRLRQSRDRLIDELRAARQQEGPCDSRP